MSSVKLISNKLSIKNYCCAICDYKPFRMDKSRSTVSLFNELNYFMIDKEYLNGMRHKQNIDYSRKCAYFYERISAEI